MIVTEDDLRPIAIIADLARDYNNLVAEWLKPILKRRMDPAQLGGEKCSSITHYLVILFNFIFRNTDSSQRTPKSVIAALIDLSKGFTRINHQKVLIRLSDWGTPGWLLRVIASYLTGRSMVVRSKSRVWRDQSLDDDAGSMLAKYSIVDNAEYDADNIQY